MTFRAVLNVLSLTLILSVCGCGEDAAKPKTTAKTDETAKPGPQPTFAAEGAKTGGEGDAKAGGGDAGKAAPSPEALAKVNLEKVDPAGLEEFVKRNKGKVVLIDYWATWCVPCLKSFPHTLEMQKKYGDKGFVAASVCMMDSDEKSTKDVMETLARLGSDIPNFISAKGADDAAFEAFDVVDLPQYRIYDREGKLAKRFDHREVESFDHTDVEKEVEAQLAK